MLTTYLNDESWLALQPSHQLEVDSANASIALKQGTVLINKTTAAAMLLGAPTAGLDDGKKLKIIAATAHAHTVTTPPNTINGASDTVTFAVVGDWVELVAYDGIWYATVGGPTPAALSEI